MQLNRPLSNRKLDKLFIICQSLINSRHVFSVDSPTQNIKNILHLTIQNILPVANSLYPSDDTIQHCVSLTYTILNFIGIVSCEKSPLRLTIKELITLLLDNSETNSDF